MQVQLNSTEPVTGSDPLMPQPVTFNPGDKFEVVKIAQDPTTKKTGYMLKGYEEWGYAFAERFKILT
jgi:rRNA maturation protein Nop10